MSERKEKLSPVKLPLYSAAHEKVGELEVAGTVFGRDGDLSLLHEAVRMQLANRRSGTASTKTKGLISGGGRKPWRQKGTGRARAGSTRSPLWRHGGTIFGPQPRDYSYKMPKKAWRAAICLAISDRAQKRQAVRRRVARSFRAENQSRQGRARQARPRARADSAGRRRRQVFTRRAQPRRAQGARASKGLTFTTCSITGSS